MKKKLFKQKIISKSRILLNQTCTAKQKHAQAVRQIFIFLVLSLGKCVAENHTEKLQLLLRSLLLKKMLHLNNFAA